MEMVQHPQRVDPFLLREWTLLPIHPPKVDPLIFEGMVEEFEVVFQKLFAGRLKGYRLE